MEIKDNREKIRDRAVGMRGVIFALTAVLIFAAGCGKAQKEKELTPFTIAFQEWVGYSLFYLARDKGFLWRKEYSLSL